MTEQAFREQEQRRTEMEARKLAVQQGIAAPNSVDELLQSLKKRLGETSDLYRYITREHQLNQETVQDLHKALREQNLDLRSLEVVVDDMRRELREINELVHQDLMGQQTLRDKRADTLRRMDKYLEMI